MRKIFLNFYLFVSFIIIAKTPCMTQNLTPDWEYPRGLVLVYPKDLRSGLIPFYEEFIKTILARTKLPELTFIVRPNAKIKIESFCNLLNTQTKIRYFETNLVQDIWARDFCPIYISNGTVCKALYNPSYFNKNQIIKFADSDNQTGIDLAVFLNLEINYFLQPGKNNLILDGGNFIHNGQGTAIMTNRVIADNETLSIDEIRKIFQKKLGISNLIFLPVEIGDETGHIDGMVRFINENTLIVAELPPVYINDPENISEIEYKIDKQFLDNIADSLSKVFSVIRIENTIPRNEGKEGLASAFGNYINFLRIGNTIFLPNYGTTQDNKATETLKKHFPKLTVVPIKTDINKLSKFGGVLNCISWTYY